MHELVDFTLYISQSIGTIAGILIILNVMVTKNTASVEVVIPIYKTEHSAYEQFSLRQCVQTLGQYSISFVKPKGLNISHLTDEYKVSSKSQNPAFFKNIASYNRMMLSAEFYADYQHVDYVLIHQLDAMVFKDELKEFCALGVDYIGAPWLSSPNSWHKKITQKFQSKLKQQRQVIFGKVGNGGLSLRKTDKFLAICKKHKDIIINNLARDVEDVYYMEDVFWSLMAPELMTSFKVADFEQGLSFAFDRKPDLALKMNKGRLPFGCHGFDKPKVRKFWQALFKAQFTDVPEF